MLFAQHIDAIIQMLVGAALTWLGFRSAGKLDDKKKKILRVCGPLLFVIGGVLFLKERPSPTWTWTRQLTSDKVASAEFPGAPTAKESTDSAGGITVKRTSLTYYVPGKDIALFLSWSPMPEEARAWTDAQRIEATLSYFASRGSVRTQSEKDPATSIYRITLKQEKGTTRMAIAYVGDNVYRAVASWTDDNEDKTLTDRFMGSFRVSRDGSPQTN
ncbi:MAG: hypothetical protein ACRELY_20175 [Polyangiaceae bacterium]